MNKKNIKKKWFFIKRHGPFFIRGTFAVAAVFILVLGMSKISSQLRAYFFSSSHVDVTCIDCYSLTQKKELVAFTQKRLLNANYLSFDGQKFYSDLREKFPFITKVVIEKRLPIGLSVKIFGSQPVMKLNKDCILATDGGVYYEGDFALWPWLDELPNINVAYVEPGMKVTGYACEKFKQLVKVFNSDYECFVKDLSAVRLVPKQPRLFEAVEVDGIDVDSSKNKIGYLDNIVTDFLHRGLCSQKLLEQKRKALVFDVRFNNRVIVKIIDRAKRRGNRV